MNKLYEFDYEGKHYVVKVNMAVRLAINEYRHNKAKLNLSDEVIDIISKIDMEKVNKDEIELKELAPLLKHTDCFESLDVDEIEVFKIVLKTLFNFTEEQCANVIDELEEKEGSLELCEIIGKLITEVFTQVERMNKALKQVESK